MNSNEGMGNIQQRMNDEVIVSIAFSCIIYKYLIYDENDENHLLKNKNYNICDIHV